MIRLRKTTGETACIQPDFRFIELCSEDGLVAAVVWQDDIGTVHIAKQGDTELSRYAHLFGAALCPLIDLAENK